MNNKLGIDFGNTIITTGPDSFWSEDHLKCPPNEGSISSIRKLIKKCGDENVFVVSRVHSEKTKSKTLEWLATHVFQQTGLLLRNIRFCWERSEKGPIVSELGITHFIDDRPEVMSGLPETCKYRYLYNPILTDVDQWEHKATVYKNWDDIYESILLTLPKESVL
jgi:hypothetical protein